MYKKLRRRIALAIAGSVFALLAVSMAAINTSNFVGAAEDADRITERIAGNSGTIGGPERDGPGMSPEGLGSIHYFVYNLTDGTLDRNSLVTINEVELESWANSLANSAEKGWTRTTYRYRLYENAGDKYVVVIDQSRELSPSYRVLWISLIVGGAGLVLVIVVGSIISKAIVKPFEENDKSQKRFIADAARTLRTPVSVISIDAATLKEKLPDDESLNSIEKQTKKLLKLASDLNSFAGASKDNANKAKTNLSNVLKDVLKLYEDGFKAAGKKLETSIEEGLEANVDDGMIRKALSEIIENLLKYSSTIAMISLRKEGDRVVLETRNDFPGIAEGSLDRVFDRFYRLDADNMSKYEGNGVGLSIVKEIVDAHRGRAKAKGEGGDFVLKIEF